MKMCCKCGRWMVVSQGRVQSQTFNISGVDPVGSATTQLVTYATGF